MNRSSNSDKTPPVVSRRRRVQGATETVNENHVESKVYIRTSLPNLPGLDPDVTEEEYTLAVHKFITEPAKVTVNCGVTKSTGEGTYEFLRLDVAITMPCYAEQVNAVVPRVADMASQYLEEEIDKYFT